MKVWVGFGSEHSYNLVLVGHFADERAARNAMKKFESLGEAAPELPDVGWDADPRFTDELRTLAESLRLYDLTRSEMENFIYEHTAGRQGSTVTLSTDEIEIQGFLKVMLASGARVEIYSAHEWNEDGSPRTEQADATEHIGDLPGEEGTATARKPRDEKPTSDSAQD